MATGFIVRHCSWLFILIWSLPALGSEVTLIGAFGDKAAIIAIGGGAPKTLKVGERFSGITLISVERTPERATIEVDGKRRVLVRGQTYSTSGANSSDSVTLAAGAGGHFMADGQINGNAIRFLVDTGATAIAIPASEANRMRIDYRSGKRGTTQTAGGPTPVYVVTLERVRIGGIELQNVEAIVIEQGLSVALLGNTFLNRVEMHRDGQAMTLKRRF